MPACCQALRARPAAALRVTAAPDNRCVAARSGRAARRLARQSQTATHRTPATGLHGPADPDPPNLAQLPAEAPNPAAPAHKPHHMLIEPHPHDTRLRRRQDQPDHQHAREHPRSKLEQPLTRPRSILDSGLSRRNTVLRCQPANMSLTTRRATRQARRPLSRATPPHRRKPTGPGLTPLPPYELSVAPALGFVLTSGKPVSGSR